MAPAAVRLTPGAMLQARAHGSQPSRSNPPAICARTTTTHNFSATVEVDVENKEYLPGLLRIPTGVGAEAPFNYGCHRIESPLDLEVAGNAAERTAESLGTEIAARHRRQIQRSTDAGSPIVATNPVSVSYALIAGTDVNKEAEGCAGEKAGEHAHAR